MNIETDSNEEETLEDKTIILDVEEKYISTITGRILYIFYQQIFYYKNWFHSLKFPIDH